MIMTMRIHLVLYSYKWEGSNLKWNEVAKEEGDVSASVITRQGQRLQ